jgi:hypothetical protein
MEFKRNVAGSVSYPPVYGSLTRVLNSNSNSLYIEHRAGVGDILTLVGNNTSAIYVREPLLDGQDHIDILLDNLRSNSVDPSSLTFEDIIVSWFSDLLLCCNQANDDTGVDNQIFQAYGLLP